MPMSAINSTKLLKMKIFLIIYGSDLGVGFGLGTAQRCNKQKILDRRMTFSVLDYYFMDFRATSLPSIHFRAPDCSQKNFPEGPENNGTYKN
jgi:hypothetical protein